MKTEIGWAIACEFGLYIGWRPIRREMIAQHVGDLHSDVNPFTTGGRLSPMQKQHWEARQKLGDRAVKIRITYSPS